VTLWYIGFTSKRQVLLKRQSYEGGTKTFPSLFEGCHFASRKGIRLNRILTASFAITILHTGIAADTEAIDGRPTPEIAVVAHRGLVKGFPENTLIAFQQALKMGVDFIEVDLRMTKDGSPVIIHDDSVDRTTDGQGEVNTFTLSQLKKLDAGSVAGSQFAGEQIPAFEEALALVIPLKGKLLLDIKSGPNLDCKEVVRHPCDHIKKSKSLIFS
jgi:glycerophosphoryl diester phosphodiesterase